MKFSAPVARGSRWTNMRTIFLAPLLAPVLATLAIATLRPADACGPYGSEPKLMRLTGHHGREASRSFVLLDQPVPNADKLAWKQLAPGTYDPAAVVDTADLERPMDMTLIGPSGTRVVSSKERVFLSRTFVSNEPSVALEISAPKGQFAIAMAGKHTDAAWIRLDREHQGSATDLSWVKAQGIDPLSPEYIYVSKLEGTDLEIITVPQNGGRTTFVRSEGALYTRFEGTAMGAMTTRGQLYLVASKQGEAVTAIAI